MEGNGSWTSRAQLVARRIGGDIISGKFPPGVAMPREAELSGHYQVSRNTLREAMKALSAKALIEIAPRRGTIVLPRARWNMLDKDVIDWIGPALWTDRTFLDEILVMRAAIEPVAAAEAAIRADKGQRAAIQHAYDAMCGLARTTEIPKKVDIDLSWHVAVAEAANNRFLVATMAGLVHALRSQLRMLNLRDGNFEGNLENHGAVTGEILAGDAEAAAGMMRQLVAHARQDTDEMLNTPRQDGGTAEEEEKKP
ncbi:FadR/GntR family transcriptional regulator [Paracoccus zhejiangensis]|uniref:HTH gntR-type domain-containing protein n=1 Tax=Paracoccus zhejiangensis TaxID=1077935 RepID=A0A2H5F4N6_9RHOB|nr:FCD domain-containing protein [Paracoccus zhejiangensis]AUH66503.1 hypothetical protein CX676_19525 [Paracoccus zhejiangensis]